RAYALRSNAILESLRAEHPEQAAGWNALIALNDYNLGHRAYSVQRYPEALSAFEASRTIRDEQLKRGEAGADGPTHLAQVLLYLCRTYLAAHRNNEALAAGQRAAAICQLLVDRYPNEYSYKTTLYLSHEELSFVYQTLDRPGDVIACHEAARAILKAAAVKH